MPIRTGRFPRKVIAIIPTADRQKATVKVRVGFEKLDPRILPEMGVKVAFQSERSRRARRRAARALIVPKAAVQKGDGATSCGSCRTARSSAAPSPSADRSGDEVDHCRRTCMPGETVVLNPPATSPMAPPSTSKSNR